MARIIDLAKLKECVSWGYQGENGATILVVNIQEFIAQYPKGQPSVIFQRQDGHPYVHNFSIAGENLFIELNSIDTQQQGKCEVQISWVGSGNRALKKQNYRSFILPNNLEDDLPLTSESVIALDNLKECVEETKKLVEEAKRYTTELVFMDSLPESGEDNKLYVIKDMGNLYFWDGEIFVLLNEKIESECPCPPLPQIEIWYGGNAFSPNNTLL